MAEYGVNYRLEFCDSRYGKACRIDLLNKNYAGPVIPYEAGAEPLAITYKNDSENKFSQVTGSEATISILSSDAFSLQNFYTSDEQQFLAKYYENDVLKWSGFILPDSANEPFLYNRYESKLQAKDILGTLKTVAFANADGTLIKKTDSYKNILSVCLSKTGLGLDFWTGVNTYATSMPNGLADDPLALAYVDTNRYIDTNGKPYSCYDVLVDICNEFSASIKQSNGAWWLVDITLLAGSSYNARRYNSAGVYIERATVANKKRAGLGQELELVDHDHNISNILAYKSVTTYYQYGYLSNTIANGNFDSITPAGSASPFEDWENLVGSNVDRGRRNALIDGVTTPINDYYAIIKVQSSGGPSLRSKPFTVLKTNTVSVSLDVGTPGPVASDRTLNVSFYIVLSADGQDPRYWTDKGWSDGARANGGTVLNFKTDWLKGEAGKTINFNITNPPHNGTVTFGISGGRFSISLVPEDASIVYFDNISWQASENQYWKAPIGNVVTLTQSGYYSAVPDVTTLLFGDDSNKDRTSWMRLSGNVPTQTWYRFGKTEALKLQEIAAKNILNQHQKTSRLFEGTLMGSFNPMDTVNIDLIDSKFFFLAGTYYAKAAKCTVKLAELFTVDLPAELITATRFEDFGEFKDKDGNTVGSPTGVSAGNSSSSSVDLSAYDTSVVAATKFQPLEDQRLSKGNSVLFGSVTGKQVNIPDTVVDKYWSIYVDSSGLGGSATAPPSGGGGSSLFSQLLDVALTADLSSGQVPMWNGSRWVNQTVVTDLSNYYTKGIANDTFLKVAPNSASPQNYNFAIGYDGARNFIQSHSGQPLDLNPLGNLITFNGQVLGALAYRNGINGNEVYTDRNNAGTDIGVAQILRWKNYGNSHVIFDASAGTSPDGRVINVRDSEIAWNNTYPTLMGSNGANTFGVRVDNARQADKAEVWNNAGSYTGSVAAVNLYMMAYASDGNWHPTNAGYVQSYLGLGTGAYNDKTKFWAQDYPDNYYLTNSYVNGYWRLASNHPSAVSVGHADTADLFQGSSIDRFQRYHSFGVDANTIADNTNSFTYAVNAPFTGTLMYFGANGYGTQINTAYGVGGSLAFRTRNGDNGTWNGWSTVWHNGSLNPQIYSVPNSVVQRDSNGYINATYINSSRTDENLGAASYLYDTGDGFIRKKSVYDAVSDFTSVNRHFALRFDSNGTAYNNGTLELANGTNRPSLGLHWQNVVASTITIEASGRVAIMNNPGTGYESFIAQNLYAANDVSGNYVYGQVFVSGTRIFAGYDSGHSGSVSASNWFRSNNSSGWINETYGGGLYMSDSTYIRTYGSRKFYCDNEIQSPVLRVTSQLFIPSRSGAEWTFSIED